jgi:hypothetical protein
VLTSRDADFEVARSVVDSYASLGGLVMGLVTGSVARGISDAASDLDIYLYWIETDCAALAGTNRLRALGADRLFGVATPTGFFEKHRLKDRLVDVESVEIAALNEVVASLSNAEVMTSRVEKTVAGLLDAVVVTGGDELLRWQHRMKYGDALATAQGAAHISGLLPPVALYRITLLRGDALSFAARLSSTLLHGVGLVGAVNRRFIATTEPKWIPWQLDRLSIRPDAMADRINEAFAHPTIETMRDLASLLDEIIDLVDRHIDAVDTRPARFALGLGGDVA